MISRVISSTRARTSSVWGRLAEHVIQALEALAYRMFSVGPGQTLTMVGTAPRDQQPRAEPLEILGDDQLRRARPHAGSRNRFSRHGNACRSSISPWRKTCSISHGGRLDVARQRNVDDEQRAVAPRPHDRLDPRFGQDRRGRSRRRDDDVAAAERGIHLFPRCGGGAADRFGGPGRVGHGSADDDDLVHAARELHMASRPKPADLAGADDDNGAAAQIPENLAGQRGRRESDRSAAAEAGLWCTRFADRRTTKWKRSDEESGHHPGRQWAA